MNQIFVLCLISFALSIEYSLGLVSIQAYWADTGGSSSLSGLAFGIYNGLTIIFSPLLAWVIDNKIASYKSVYMLCILINVIGNCIYSFAHLANTWIMVLVGRGLAGIGATCVPLLMMYIGDKIDEKDQQKTVGYVKYTAAFSGSAGAILGSFFSSCVGRTGLFNMFTLVGWIPMFLGTVTLVIVACWKETNIEREYAGNTTMSTWDIMKYFFPIWFLGFISTFIYWFYMGNAFILGTHFFHVINSPNELGYLYYSGLGAFGLSFVIFLFFKKSISNERGLLLSTIILVPTVFLFTIQHNFMYYVAVGATTFANGFMIPSINYQNNVLAKNLKSVLKGKFGIMLISLSIVQGLAQFVGPTLFSLTIHQDDDNNCKIDGDKYETSGCKLENFFEIVMAYNLVSAILMIFSYYNFIKKITKSKTDPIIQPVLPSIQSTK